MSNPPMGLASNQIMLIYPLSSMENVLGWNYSEMPVEMYFKVNNNETVYKKCMILLKTWDYQQRSYLIMVR